MGREQRSWRSWIAASNDWKSFRRRSWSEIQTEAISANSIDTPSNHRLYKLSSPSMTVNFRFSMFSQLFFSGDLSLFTLLLTLKSSYLLFAIPLFYSLTLAILSQLLTIPFLVNEETVTKQNSPRSDWIAN